MAPPKRGTVRKSDLIREIAATLQQPWDTDKILTLARNKLAALPEAARKGVQIKRNDVSYALRTKDSKREQTQICASANGAALPADEPIWDGLTDTLLSARQSIPGKPPPESFTEADLLAGKEFLDACGNSIVRAQALIRVVSKLTNKETINDAGRDDS